MKKVFFPAAAVAAIAGIAALGLASCGAKKQEAAASTGPVTLSFWVQETLGKDYNTIIATTEYEKKTGVHIDWKLFPSSQNGNEAFNLMIAGGNLPDILGSTHGTERINMLVEGGLALALDTYIQNAGSNYNKMLQEQPQYRDMVTADDGHIYSFVYTDSGVHKDSEYKMWVKTEWLAKLGLKEPSTPQEFADMIRAFIEQDPNGNGKKDELPLVGWVNGRQADPINFLMNPYQLFREGYHYRDDSGKVIFIANTDGWRDGLRYLASLYKQGLIMPETYVQDETQFKNLLNRPSEEAIVGVFPAWYQGAYIDHTVLNWNDYTAISPLKGPSGLQQTAARKGGNFNLNGIITTACKNPDAAFAWMDYFLSDAGNELSMFGVEGVTFERVDAPDWNGKSPSIKLHPDFDKLNTIMMPWNSGTVPRYDKAAVRYSTTADMSRIEADNTYVLVEAAKKYEPYYVWHNIPDIVWCSDQDILTKRTDYATVFNDFIKTEYTAFIRGDKDINSDAAWNAYKAELDRLGLADYIATLQKYYN
ncbi:MAG: extracellular solute-binding protein [Treponema sp.]|jgi:putative aldouronate transport system substrate-binding protein|nr:extracellular solute-binding protein [Treponema sp.]